MRYSFVLLAVAIAACSSPTEHKPVVPPGTPLVVNGTFQAGSLGGPADTTAITADTGTVTVAGTYWEGMACNLNLVFGGYRSSDTLVLQIYGAMNPPTGQICEAMPESWPYSAQVVALPPATYTLLIQYPDNTWHWYTAEAHTVTVK